MAFLVFSACGKVDNPPPPDAAPDAPVNNDGIRSGTRLKVRWNDFDGTRSFAGLFDTTRNEICTPRKFADAKTYCVPASTTIAYRDAACTQPIGRQLRTCPLTPLLYFTETDLLTCDSLPKKIFPRGAQLSLPTYYLLTSTGCSGPNDSTSYDLYALGPEIPLTEFATIEAPVTVEPGRIQQRFFESSDGARTISAMYDNELGSECTLALDVTRSNARCVPTTTGLGSIYGDAGCTLQRTSFRKGCTVPKYASRFTRFCSFTTSVPDLYRTGALASATYSGAPGSCTPFTADPSLSYYDVPNTLVEPGTVTRAPDTEGIGRYRLLHYTSGNNSLRDTALYDTLRQTECTPTTMQDGSVRCLPITVYGTSTYFSDAGCTVQQPVIVVPNAPAAGCSLPPLPAFSTRIIITTTPACTVTREARAVGAVYTGTLYTGSPANCVAATFTTSTVYTLGTVSSLDDFPAATVVTEP